MATLTATVDDVDRLLVHFDVDVPDSLFWSYDDSAAHAGASTVTNQIAPAHSSHRYPVPGSYVCHVHDLSGDLDTEVTVDVPGSAGSGGMTLTSIAPVNGPNGGGTHVVCRGTGLTVATNILLRDVAVANFVVIDDTQVEGDSRLGIAGLGSVIVAGAGTDGVALPWGWTYT